MESVYIGADEFPIENGDRMCPRCMCCSVGVGDSSRHVNVPQIGMDNKRSGVRILSVQFVPSASSLRREPSVDVPDVKEAWYCRGGCDRSGKHLRDWPEVSFIGFVKRTT